ncbi:hypothetical protein [Spirillospora sp. NPDC029432]|uniref:hypothetical protein n=1 Tax=Spirillospora sp. NPDC029432 TaxID=3154599 RepID=UPI003451655E
MSSSKRSRSGRARGGEPRQKDGRKGGTYQRSRVYFLAAGGLGLVIVLALAVVLVSGGDGKAPAAKGPAGSVGQVAQSGVSPASYSSSPSTGAYAKIEQRSADAAPLTEGEAFPDAKLAVPGAELSLKGKRLDGDCGAAVWGTGVAEVLRQGACTQAARAVYAGEEHSLTVAVFNLAGKESADRLVGTLGSGGGFVRPLDGFGQGFSMARGLAMGHYAVVSWVQRADGKGDAQDDELLTLLIEGGKAPGPLGRAARAS